MRIVRLPFNLKKPILACGADLKGAFALARGDEAFLFDGFGDLADLDNFTRYERSIKAAVRRLGIRPAVVACDLHPGYFSTRFAREYTNNEQRTTLNEIQHHEAHIASAIVDSSIKGNVIGVAFDGTGYGSDGNIWGGEFFVVRRSSFVVRGEKMSFKRAGHLAYVPMPGGEMAIREPWRMALGYLCRSCGETEVRRLIKLGLVHSPQSTVHVLKMIEKKINSPLTSSAGRLFDAVGSMVMGKAMAEKEAQLPMELERIAIELCRDSYKFDIEPKGKELIISCKKMVKGIVTDLKNKADKPTVSSKFHNTVAEIILKTSLKLRKQFRIGKAVLSGGVFQNAYLTSRTKEILIHGGFKVFVHSSIPTNDSGIPVGQIAIADARVR